MAIEPRTLRVKRAWPGVTRGQRITTDSVRAARLIAAGMAEAVPVRRRAKAAPEEKNSLFAQED